MALGGGAAVRVSAMHTCLIAEELLEFVTRELHARDRRSELGGRVADDVVRALVAQRDAQQRRGAVDVEPALAQSGCELRAVVVQLDDKPLGQLGEGGHGSVVAELSGVDRDEMLAHPLDLTE